ncbi:hypothetical protein [Argonema antarcticum]|uniref:hypothetical protein n=1 Tax=Argonema antarcticum TaxID=2942763 RepID=UPI002011649B|nr:hypothetical protein [Argonema antarcticum]MCL1470203.1 hypothetical protein [Argonema antarcticum A004/B2]
MTQIELKTHQLWQDLNEILEYVDADALVQEHLESCNYKIGGYWDETDEFYEEIALPRFLSAELISSSIGVTRRKRWIQLKFALQADGIASQDKPEKIGELILIYDESMQFIDENWVIYVDSPLLKTNIKKG